MHIDYSKISDEDLVDLVKSGNVHAFEALLARYGGALHVYARKILTDPEEARDAVQDVWVAIWARSDQFDRTVGKFSTWAHVMVRNRCIDRIRSTERRAKYSNDFGTEVRHNPEQYFGRGEEVADYGLAELVTGLLDQLTEEQRTAIFMNFYQGVTHEQIAIRLDEPAGTIKARIRRGMIILRNILDHPAYDDVIASVGCGRPVAST